MTRRVSLVVLGALAFSVSSVQAEDNAQFRTAVSVTGGLSVGSEGGLGRDIAERFGFGRSGGSDAGLAVGGGIARDLNPRLTLEANGAYFDRGSGGWSADAGLRLNLVPASRTLVPYFAVSGGLIGGETRRNERDVFGPMVTAFVDSRVQPPRGIPQTRPGRGVNVMPAVTTAMQQLDDFRSGGSYTDGMLTMGGGVRFDAGPHVFVRPDVRAQLVFSNDTRVLGLFTLNFGYRF